MYQRQPVASPALYRTPEHTLPVKLQDLFQGSQAQAIVCLTLEKHRFTAQVCYAQKQNRDIMMVFKVQTQNGGRFSLLP